MCLSIYKRFFGTTQQIAWIGLLLIVAFNLYGFVPTAMLQAEQKTTSVKLSVSNDNCNSKQERDAYNYEGWQVKISREGFADQVFTVDRSGNAVVSITSADVGQYDISIIVPNTPKARALSASINYNAAQDSTGVVKEQEYTEVDYGKDNKVSINFHTRWYNFYYPPPESPYLKVSVTEIGCDQAKKVENEIDVVVASFNCNSSPLWNTLKVSIGEKQFDVGTEKDEFVEKARRKPQLKINPGKYNISVRSTDFPETTVRDVIIYQVYKKSTKTYTKDVGIYSPDDSGIVTVTLDKSLWKKSSKFLGLTLFINLWGNCENPGTDPDKFAIVKVKAVSGTVEAKQPFTLPKYDKKPGRTLSIDKKSNVNDKYMEETIIKTGADGLIVLESEYKHTITIENSTEVKLGTVMTADGRRQLKALVEKGKIKIERKTSNTKDDSSETTVQTKTAIVSSTKTIYTVSYDETTNQTTVGVEEGQVEVFPEDETLQSVTLEANQQVQVSDKSVSTVTPYSGEAGNKTAFFIILIGVIFAAIIGLLVIVVGIFIVYRMKN